MIDKRNAESFLDVKTKVADSLKTVLIAQAVDIRCCNHTKRHFVQPGNILSFRYFRLELLPSCHPAGTGKSYGLTPAYWSWATEDGLELHYPHESAGTFPVDWVNSKEADIFPCTANLH